MTSDLTVATSGSAYSLIIETLGRAANNLIN